MDPDDDQLFVDAVDDEGDIERDEAEVDVLEHVEIQMGLEEAIDREEVFDNELDDLNAALEAGDDDDEMHIDRDEIEEDVLEPEDVEYELMDGEVILEDDIVNERELEMIDGNEYEDRNHEFSDSEEDSESGAESHEQEASSVDGDQSEQQPYEISRSSRHEYLGAAEELTGRTIVEEEDCITIPILVPSSAHNLVLLPNQILPLTIFCPMQQSMLRKVIAEDKIIGIIHARIRFSGLNNLDQYGTTAEIFEFFSGNDRPSLSLKAKGRQRFKVLSTHREVTGCLVARVKILPEIRMTDPLQHVRLSSQLRRNMSQNTDVAGLKLRVRSLKSLRPTSAWKARKEAAVLTPWPPFVYDMYDDEQLATRLVNDIVKQYDMIDDKLEVPRDPQEMSHWAANNITLNDSQRLTLLSLNTATQRLRYLLSITSQINKRLLCSYCGKLIAHTHDIFCMSIEGPQGTFVNPEGYIHEMITVSKASNIRVRGKASTLHSWFPGYAWTIASCSSCDSHVGWLFTAKKKLKPKSFYGITRISVKNDVVQFPSQMQYVI